MMKHVLDALREAGTPKEVPIMVTESHISWRADWADEHDLRGALAGGQHRIVFREAAAPRFITRRFSRRPCRTPAWGPAYVVELRGGPRLQHYRDTRRPYWGARMINLEWVQHRSGVHHMFPSTTGDRGRHLVRSAPSRRQLVSHAREPQRDEPAYDPGGVRGRQGQRLITGPVTMVTFGSEQYVWKPDGREELRRPRRPACRNIPDRQPANDLHAAESVGHGDPRQN